MHIARHDFTTQSGRTLMVGTVSRESRHASKLRRSSTRRPSASAAALRRSCLFFDTTCAPEDACRVQERPPSASCQPANGPTTGKATSVPIPSQEHLCPVTCSDGPSQTFSCRTPCQAPTPSITHWCQAHIVNTQHTGILQPPAHLFQVVHVEHARGALQLVDIRGDIPRHRDVHKAPHAADGGRR